MAIEHLMVAAPLAATEVGHEFDSLPPHVAIFPWFEMADSHWPAFDAAMRNIIDDTMRPAIQGGHIELPFGAEESDAARVVSRAGQEFVIVNGKAIHTEVYKAVRRYGDYDPTFVGSRWLPSMGSSGAYELTRGEQIIVPDLTVFQRRKAMGKHVVRAVYTWEHALHEHAAARS